jgi:hypothetical protein
VLSERSARRIEKKEHQTQQQPRQYRTRKDHFNGLFEQHLVPLLKENPALQPITLLDELADKAPNQFDQSHLIPFHLKCYSHLTSPYGTFG